MANLREGSGLMRTRLALQFADDHHAFHEDAGEGAMPPFLPVSVAADTFHPPPHD